MHLYQVKGIPDDKVELLEMTSDGNVKIRSLKNNQVFETTQLAFEMAFEGLGYVDVNFEKAKEQAKVNKITQTEIDEILEKSQMEIMEPFGKCTIVAVKLQNGFIITESNVCLDPESYNKELGIQICVERIKNRIWELESYKQQSLLAE